MYSRSFIQYFVVIVALFYNVDLIAQEPADYSIEELDSIMESYMDVGAYGPILAFAEVGLQKAEQAYGKEDTIYARMVFFMALSHHVRQGFDQAVAYYEEAIKIQKAKIPASPDYAHSLNNIGALYYSLGLYDKAEPYFIASIDLNVAAFGANTLEHGSGLNNLGNLYWRMGRYNESEALFLQVISIREKILGTNNTETASAWGNLANLYQELGRYEEAEALYINALKVLKSLLGENNRIYANNLNSFAVLYRKMGRLEEALPLYKESMNIRKKNYGEQHQLYGESLSNLAAIYWDLEEYKKTEPLYLACQNILEGSVGKKHPSYLMNLNNLASIYTKLNRYETAEPMFQQLIALQKEVLGEEHVDYAMSLENLAGLYLNNNRFKLAVPFYMQALNIRKKALGERHPAYIGSLLELAKMYTLKNELDSAWLYSEMAIEANTGAAHKLQITEEWFNRMKDANYVNTTTMVNTLRCIYDIIKRRNRGIVRTKTKEDAYLQQQALVVELSLFLLNSNRNFFTGTSDKLRTLKGNKIWANLALNVLNPKTEVAKAFTYAEQTKSVLLMEASQTERAYTFGDLPDSLAKKEQAYQLENEKLRASILEKRPDVEKDSLRALLNELNIKIKDFKGKLEKNYPKYTALKYKQKEVELKTIQALLTKESSFLEYFIGDSTVYVFYVDQEAARLINLKIDVKELNAQIKKLHEALSNYKMLMKKPEESYQKYTNTAFWFYEKLVQPALSTQKDKKNLIVVTDGALGHLPFEAFLVEQAPQAVTDYGDLHYLMEDFKISYNYSALLWKENLEQKKRPNNRQMLAMAANYDYTLDTTKSKPRLPVYQRLRSNLNALPAAKKEVETLSKQFLGFFAFDSITTEKVFYEKAPDYSIIHLAMHGILDEKSPLLSSLVFSEDGDSVHNNLLQAYEISKMHLNADLVVLSACETGYGRFEEGNGIASLARSFMYAGASSLVVSLWQVNDFATAEVMQAFYENLKNGMPKSQALRAAKLSYMESVDGVAAHPIFWSSFILFGNDDVIVLATPTHWTYWLIAGFVLFGGLLFVGIKARRGKEVA